MATKNIQQGIIPLGKGIHRSPSIPVDGELSECVNLVPKGEELTGMPVPVDTGITLESGKGETLACVHHVGTSKHYITIIDNWGKRKPSLHYEFKVVREDTGVLLYTNYIQDGLDIAVKVAYKLGEETVNVTLTGVSCTLPLVYNRKWNKIQSAEITGLPLKDSQVTVEVIDNTGNAPYVYTATPARVSRYTLAYFTEENADRVAILDTGNSIRQVMPYGNLLILRYEDSITRVLYRDGQYLNLGEDMPDLNVRLALDGEFVWKSSVGVVSMVEGSKSVVNYDTLLFTISDPTTAVRNQFVSYLEPYPWGATNNMVLTSAQKLKKEKTYKFVNNSKYDVLLCYKQNVPAYGSIVIPKNGSTTHRMPVDSDKVYYTSNGYQSEKTFMCSVAVYSATTQSGSIVPANTADNLTAVMGIANDYLASAMSEKSRFVMPFFARVGLRLYDGTISRLSVPVLLVPNSAATPGVIVLGESAGDYPGIAFACQCALQYEISPSVLANLSAWKDLIRSLVVCVTPPIYAYDEGYTYEQDKVNLRSERMTLMTGQAMYLDGTGFSVSRIAPQSADTVSYTANTEIAGEVGWYDNSSGRTLHAGDVITWQSSSPGNMYVFRDSSGTPKLVADLAKASPTYTVEQAGTYYFGGAHIYTTSNTGSLTIVAAEDACYHMRTINSLLSKSDVVPAGAFQRILLPEFDKDDALAHYTETSNFYVLDEIPLGELKAGWNTIDTTGKDLRNIPSWEAAPDDNRSHDQVSASVMFSYNSRLHLGDLRERVWGGTPLFYQTGYENPQSSSTYALRAIVSISENGKTVQADTGWGDEMQQGSPYWFYYPNANAKSAQIFIRRSENEQVSYSKCAVTLTRHKLLDGAYWFQLYDYMPFAECTEEEANKEVEDDSLYWPNKLYVSDTDNPWSFPTTQRISIGAGQILDLATTATALSQNPYGRSVLQAFCSDGIWELETSDTGKYMSKNPTSRDVILRANSVVMLDGAIAFPTAQGLKVLSSQGVNLVSETIDGYNVSEADPNIVTPLSAFSAYLGVDSPLVEDSLVFRDALQDAFIAYDYAYQCLHVFTGDAWHYVLNMSSGEWAVQSLPYRVTSVVADYPNAYLCASDGHVYTYRYLSTTEAIGQLKSVGYALTRPLALDNPMSRKMLYDLRTVSQYATDGSMSRVAVFASNDLRSWHPVTSLKGFSAKYYRLLVMAGLSELDTLKGVVLQYVERFTGKMR